MGVWLPTKRRFHLDADGNGAWGASDLSAPYGEAGDLPVVGDWNGDGEGEGEIGVYRPATGVFYLDSDRSFGATEGDQVSSVFGGAADVPLSWRW